LNLWPSDFEHFGEKRKKRERWQNCNSFVEKRKGKKGKNFRGKGKKSANTLSFGAYLESGPIPWEPNKQERGLMPKGTLQSFDPLTRPRGEREKKRTLERGKGREGWEKTTICRCDQALGFLLLAGKNRPKRKGERPAQPHSATPDLTQQHDPTFRFAEKEKKEERKRGVFVREGEGGGGDVQPLHVFSKRMAPSGRERERKRRKKKLKEGRRRENRQPLSYHERLISIRLFA